MSSTPKTKAWLVRVVHWVLGGVFIYAGTAKLADPLAFADSVASFRMLPMELISPLALTVPAFELLLGISLVVGVRRRACAVMLATLCAIFAVALTQALLRGLVIDCGCFGTGSPSTLKTVWSLTRDVGLGLLAIWLARQ